MFVKHNNYNHEATYAQRRRADASLVEIGTSLRQGPHRAPARAKAALQHGINGDSQAGKPGLRDT